MRQHTLGVVGYLVWILFTIYTSFRRWKNFENRLGFDKFITISWVVHFLGIQCRWNSTGCSRRLCLRLLWPLTFWPNQHVSCASTHMTQFWRKYSRRYSIHPVFGSLPLWPWPLTPKVNQHIYEPNYICDRKWPKFRSPDQWFFDKQQFLCSHPINFHEHETNRKIK